MNKTFFDRKSNNGGSFSAHLSSFYLNEVTERTVERHIKQITSCDGGFDNLIAEDVSIIGGGTDCG